jgi:PAS domain S-box-containing protein
VEYKSKHIDSNTDLNLRKLGSDHSYLLALFDNSTIGMVICDLNGKFLNVNEQFLKISGYSKEELSNMTFKEITHPEDLDTDLSLINELLAGKRKSYQLEKRYITKDKKVIWVNLLVSVVLDTKNNFEVFVGTVEEISDKKKIIEELKKSKTDYKKALKLLKSIQDAIPDVIGVQDNDQRIVHYNQAGYKMLNKTYEEVVGKKCYELIGRTKQCDICSTAAAIKTQKPSRHEQYIAEIDTWLDMRAYPIFDDNNEIIYLVEHLRDITDFKKLELQLKNTNNELTKHKNNLEFLVKERTEDLEAANKELKATNEEIRQKNEIINERNEELNQTLNNLKETQLQLLQAEKMASIGTLTAGVAHEINNPLNYLMGAYVGLTNYFGENESNEKEKTEILLHSIKIGIERISNIVKGLNQFSRKNDNLDETCDIHTILDNCIEILYHHLKNKAKLNKKYSEIPVLIKGNVGKLHQVFLNILTNSVQAILKNGTIDVITSINEKSAVIEILDNGIGIEKEFINQITDPFFTTKRPGEGTGLGLSITNSIVQEHKGMLEFKSEKNKGTKVRVILPLNR